MTEAAVGVVTPELSLAHEWQLQGRQYSSIGLMLVDLDTGQLQF